MYTQILPGGREKGYVGEEIRGGVGGWVREWLGCVTKLRLGEAGKVRWPRERGGMERGKLWRLRAVVMRGEFLRNTMSLRTCPPLKFLFISSSSRMSIFLPFFTLCKMSGMKSLWCPSSHRCFAKWDCCKFPFRKHLLCSSVLVRNALPVCPTYTASQSLHLSLYIPLPSNFFT